jgi:hypothetical protein
MMRRIPFAHGLSLDLQGLLEQWLGLGVLAHGVVERGQVIQACGVVRMPFAPSLSLDFQGLLE